MPEPHASQHLSPHMAIQAAATVWVAMLILLLAVFLFAFTHVLPLMQVHAGEDGATFVPVLVINIVIVSAVGMTHWYLFHRYWQGGLVQPRGYLIASIILYTGITLCVLLSVVGMMIDRSLFPNILLAVLFMLLLLAVWPSGRAMRVPRRRGEVDDDVDLFHLPSEDDQQDR